MYYPSPLAKVALYLEKQFWKLEGGDDVVILMPLVSSADTGSDGLSRVISNGVGTEISGLYFELPVWWYLEYLFRQIWAVLFHSA